MTHRLPAMISLFAFVLASSVMAASITTHADLKWDSDDWGGNPFVSHGSCVQDGAGSSSCMDDISGVFAKAEAGYGWLDVQAETYTYKMYFYSEGSAFASFEDNLVFTGPHSEAFVRVNYQGYSDRLDLDCNIGGYSFCSMDFPPDERIPITLGESTNFRVGAGSYMDGDYRSWSCCVSSQFQLLSFTITDANGQPLPGIRVRSESGTAYSLDGADLLTAPEPAAWLLMVLGGSLAGIRTTNFRLRKNINGY